MTRKEKIVLGLVQIAEGFVLVFSLGAYTPDWTFHYIVNQYYKKAKQ